MTGKIRIIAGIYKGKTLSVLNAPSLRPTPHRIRETLFNWLMHDIRGAHCLDAFAGSGSLGIEALSRGAASVVLLEKNPSVYTKLKQSLKAFPQPSLHLIQTDAVSYLKSTSDPFDIIFLDPPFNSTLLNSCLELLASRLVLKTQGLVYMESADPISADPHCWDCLHQKKAGQVHYGLYQKTSENEAVPANGRAWPSHTNP